MAGYPQIDTQMPGGPAEDERGYFGREGVSTGTHDPLYARALVLDNGQKLLALVAVDLVAVESAFTASVRTAVHQAIGIPPEHLLIGASHTHSGPALFRWADDLDPDVEPQVQRGIVQAVRQAYQNRRPARIGWADTYLDCISINRRDPAGPIDPRVGVMRVEDENEVPIALVVNFAIHTCLISALNLSYTADVSGCAMETLERAYPGAVAMFLNGAAGNINPAAYPWGPKENVIPLFRKLWHAGQPHPRTFRNAVRLGNVLAGSVLQAAEQVAQCHTDLSLAGRVQQVTVPLKSAEELGQFRQFMNLAPSFGGSRLAAEEFHTEVQALAIGSKLYVGLPGEPFVELGLDLQHRFGHDRTYVVGYANDDARYVLPQAAYEDNRYDTWASVLGPGSGEMLLDAAERAVRELNLRGALESEAT
jgi:hypothetical protein